MSMPKDPIVNVFHGETLPERIAEFNMPNPKMVEDKLLALKASRNNTLVDSPVASEKPLLRVPMTLLEMNQVAEEQSLIAAIKKEWSDYYKLVKKVQPEEYKKLFSPAGVVMLDIKADLQDKYKYGLSKSEIYAYWIVVSPKTDTADFKLLMEYGLKLLNKKQLVGTESWFSIEQRGVTSNEMGYGPHINLLIKKMEEQYYEPKRFEKMVRNHFKRVQEDIDNVRFIWFKAVSKDKWENKIKYIKGYKSDVKLESVKIDKIWRQTLNIKDYYHFI